MLSSLRSLPVAVGAALVLQSCKTINLIGDVPNKYQDIVAVTESASCALWCSEKTKNADGMHFGYSAESVDRWSSTTDQYNAVLDACAKISNLDSQFRSGLQSGKIKVLGLADDSWGESVNILHLEFGPDKRFKAQNLMNSGYCKGKKYIIEVNGVKRGIIGKKQVFLWAAPAGNEVIASPRKGSFNSVEPSASENIGHYWLFFINEIRAQFAIRGFALSLAIFCLSMMLFLCWRFVQGRRRR